MHAGVDAVTAMIGADHGVARACEGVRQTVVAQQVLRRAVGELDHRPRSVRRRPSKRRQRCAGIGGDFETIHVSGPRAAGKRF